MDIRIVTPSGYSIASYSVTLVYLRVTFHLSDVAIFTPSQPRTYLHGLSFGIVPNSYLWLLLVIPHGIYEIALSVYHPTPSGLVLHTPQFEAFPVIPFGHTIRYANSFAPLKRWYPFVVDAPTYSGALPASLCGFAICFLRLSAGFLN